MAIAIGVGAAVHPAGYALLLAPLAMTWLLVRPRQERDARAVHVEQYALTRLDPPSAWEPAAVEARLAQLEEERARRAAARREAVVRERLEQQVTALEPRAREIGRRRAELAATLGLEVPRSDLVLVELASSVLALRKAHGEVLAASERAESVEHERGELQGKLAAWARSHGELEPYASLAWNTEWAGSIQLARETLTPSAASAS